MRQLTIVCDEAWAQYVQGFVGVVEEGEVFAVLADIRVCPECGEELGDNDPECSDDDQSPTESMACDR